MLEFLQNSEISDFKDSKTKLSTSTSNSKEFNLGIDAEIDVINHLERLSSEKNLNWKVSIVDLLKLLNLDTSYEARKQLAKELNIPKELIQDSERMNAWLHKAVLRKIAENNGIKFPSPRRHS